MTPYNELLNELDIVEVISSYIQLKQKGDSYAACCPFHDEDTASFSVSPSLQIFKCFSSECSVAGNAISFVSQYEDISYHQAFIQLCRKHNLEKLISKDFKKLIKLYKTNKQIASLYHLNLRDPSRYPKAIKYLKERGLNSKVVKAFNLGYAPKDRYFLQRNGFTAESLEPLRLIKDSKLTPKKEHFYNRVIIPFYQNGNIVGFSGRTIEDVNPKYLNTKESEIFKKKDILFGWYQNKKTIRSRKQLILVEGQFDVITLYSKGLNYCGAFAGSFLSEASANTIVKSINELLFFADGDKAGVKAASRIIKRFLKEDLNIKIIYCEDEDPDSLLNKMSWNQVRSSYTYKPIDFLYEFLGVDSAIESISTVNDPFKQGKLLKKLSEITGKEEFRLQKMLKPPVKTIGIRPIEDPKSMHPFTKVILLTDFYQFDFDKIAKNLLLEHIKTMGFKSRREFIDEHKRDPAHTQFIFKLYDKAKEEDFVKKLKDYVKRESLKSQLKALKDEYTESKDGSILNSIQQLMLKLNEIK